MIETLESAAIAETSFRTSETLSEFAKALVKAQAKFESPKRDKTAKMDKYSYTYADLASVIDAIRKGLTDAGIAVIQSPTTGDDEMQVIVTTRLLHASGEWVESSLRALAGSNTPQGIGSAITYLRRYALSAMTGIATEEDDDGAAAAQKKRKSREPAKGSAHASPPQSPELEAAAAKLRGALLKRSTSNADASALLISITKDGKRPGIRIVDAFRTLEQVDQAWARLQEISEDPMMPTAKPDEAGPVAVTSEPAHEPEEVRGDSNLFSS